MTTPSINGRLHKLERREPRRRYLRLRSLRVDLREWRGPGAGDRPVRARDHPETRERGQPPHDDGGNLGETSTRS